tara:strand:- start:8046 stop:8291 length:246 start_codon:yes stop_codon:yes gene_type:complete
MAIIYTKNKGICTLLTKRKRMFNFMKKNKSENKFKTFQVRQIPAPLWAKFKSSCMKDDVTLNDCIIDLVTEFVKGNIKYND